jgi:hypothetical protein
MLCVYVCVYVVCVCMYVYVCDRRKVDVPQICRMMPKYDFAEMFLIQHCSRFSPDPFSYSR